MSKSMGFECVVRALQLERKVRRAGWNEGEYIVKEGTTIDYWSKINNVMARQTYWAVPEEIFATDWEVLE